MMQAFTRNYEDNSTEAGYQFTFYCDHCRDGFKSSFIESTTYKKGRSLRTLTEGASVLGGLLGGAIGQLSNASERAGSLLQQNFEDRSPAWMKEHEEAFDAAQNEAQPHFHRCNGCSSYVCDACYNEDEGLCIGCAPRQEVYVAKAKADAMKRNIDAAGQDATVWQGNIESKTTVCPVCGKPAGSGKFCNNCGASMELRVCPNCGAKNALTVRFCNNCGASLSQPAPAPSGACPACGTVNPPGTRFCGNCGGPLA